MVRLTRFLSIWQNALKVIFKAVGLGILLMPTSWTLLATPLSASEEKTEDLVLAPWISNEWSDSSADSWKCASRPYLLGFRSTIASDSECDECGVCSGDHCGRPRLFYGTGGESECPSGLWDEPFPTNDDSSNWSDYVPHGYQYGKPKTVCITYVSSYLLYSSSGSSYVRHDGQHCLR